MFISSELRISLICRSGEVFHSLSFSSSPWFCNEKKNVRLVSQTKLKDEEYLMAISFTTCKCIIWETHL